MDKIALQAKLDEQKWNDSVSNHRDMCGAYDYCAFCDKSVALPCATAFEEMNKPQILPASDNEHPVKVAITAEKENEDVTDLHSSLGKKFDYDKVMAKRRQERASLLRRSTHLRTTSSKNATQSSKTRSPQRQKAPRKSRAESASNATRIDAKATSWQRSP